MVATPQKYRNPRQGYYTDLGVDTTPVGAIVYNLKSGQNTFDHSFTNDLSRHDRLSEVAGNAYICLLYTSPSQRDATLSGIPSCG